MADPRTKMALSMVYSMGPVHWRRLAGELGGEASLLEVSEERLLKSGATAKIAKDLSTFDQWEKVDESLDILDSINARIIHIDDPEYPEPLKKLRDAPMVLFVRGAIKPEDELALGIVGTRKPGDYGLRIAKKLSNQIAGSGVTIISGLALGIDGEAHRGALGAKGRTIAVLGSGIDKISPPSHNALGTKIIKSGAVISEFPPGTPPNPFNFPRRNRIIAGLSAGVLAVAVPAKSGAGITIKYAIDQNKDVFIVPGPIDDKNFTGSHKWIREGATAVFEAMDVLEKLVPDAARRMGRELNLNANDSEPLPRPKLPPDLDAIFTLLGVDPVHIDNIAQDAHLTSKQVSTILLELELRGLAVQMPGNMYRINTEN